MVKSLAEFVLTRLLSRFHLPLASNGLLGPPSSKVVVLAPHIDDETISCGGTLRQHVLRGDKVTVVFLTDGSRCANASSDIIARREMEAQRAVAQILGVQQLLFLRYPDKGLIAVPVLDQRLRMLMRELSPDILYVPSAWDRHPDHIATAKLACVAMECVQQTVRLYESFCPLTPYLINQCVDISESLAAKVAALKEFTSQVVSFDSILLLNRVHVAATHQLNAKSVEVFLDVPPSRYRQVFQAMALTRIRPRHITCMRNVLRVYLTNLILARRLSQKVKRIL